MFNQFRILKDTVGYSASSVAAQGLGMIAGFWVARTLGPSDFGIWNAASLVLTYGAYLDFGALSAMGRDLPFHLGRNDYETAYALEGAARWATVVGALAVAAAVVATVLWSTQTSMKRAALGTMAIVLVMQQMYTYHRTVLRAHNEFGELGRQQLLLSVATAGLAALGVTVLGLLGRVFAAVLAQGAVLIYATKRHPWRPLPTPKPALVWSLVLVGMPITMSGSILSLVATVDRLMVLGLLGETQLGYFGLALLVTSVVSLVPAMASQVLYPRITYQFGQSGRSIAALRAFVLIPPVVLACLVPIVIGPVYVMLPVIIKLLLPAYSQGIQATRIVVAGIFFYSILGVTDYFLVTIGKVKQYALLGASALAVNVACDYLAVRLGYGINGIAFAGTPLTYFLYSSALIGYALSHYTRVAADWYHYFARLWIPFVYMVALLWLVELAVGRWIPSRTAVGVITAMSVEVVLYLLGAFPLVFLAARELKLELSLESLARLRSGG